MPVVLRQVIRADDGPWFLVAVGVRVESAELRGVDVGDVAHTSVVHETIASVAQLVIQEGYGFHC